MERSRTRHDETGRVAMTLGPDWEHSASTPMRPTRTSPMRSIQAVSTVDVTQEALHLALSALQIHLAWHAGTVSAEAAMECLHREIGETVGRRNESSPAGSSDRAISLRRLESPYG